METSPPSPPSQAMLDAYDGYRLADVGIFFLTLEVVCVVLQIISRRLSRASLGTDDILIFPSLIICASVPAIGIAMVKFGGCGRHVEAIAYKNPEKLVTLSKLSIALSCVYLWAVALPRFIILIRYLRVFTSSIFKKTVYALGGIIMANLIACFIALMLECEPFEYNWNTGATTPGGSCFDRSLYFQYASLASIITNAVMLFLALCAIWKIQVSKGMKLGISAVILVGITGLAASVFRMSSFSFGDIYDDFSWSVVDPTIWSIAETGIYLVVACLPSYRALFIYLSGKDPSHDPQSEAQTRIWPSKVYNASPRRDRSYREVREALPFQRPFSFAYVAHAESQIPSSGRQSANGYGPQVIRVKHAFDVQSLR